MRNEEANKAEQALHVAALVIEKMREAIPRRGGHHVGGSDAYAVTLSVAREHDKMVTMLIVSLAPFTGALQAEIVERTPHFKQGHVTLKCEWRPTPKPGTPQRPECKVSKWRGGSE